MVTRLGCDVDMIISELERLGIAKDTVVVFAADNGHELYYSSNGISSLKPYRNIKIGHQFNNIMTKFYSSIGGYVFNGGLADLKRSNWERGVRLPLMIANGLCGVRHKCFSTRLPPILIR